MKGLKPTLGIILLALLPLPALASSLIGGGSYASGVVLKRAEQSDETFKFHGHIVYGTQEITSYLALRGTYYLQREQNDSQLKIRGYNGQLLVGNNFGRRGFNTYLGIGYYLESIQHTRRRSSVAGVKTPDDEQFEGLQLALGLAYNWNRISLDWWVTARDTRQYVTYLKENNLYHDSRQWAEVTSASTGLALSLRF